MTQSPAGIITSQRRFILASETLSPGSGGRGVCRITGLQGRKTGADRTCPLAELRVPASRSSRTGPLTLSLELGARPPSVPRPPSVRCAPQRLNATRPLPSRREERERDDVVVVRAHRAEAVALGRSKRDLGGLCQCPAQHSADGD